MFAKHVRNLSNRAFVCLVTKRGIQQKPQVAADEQFTLVEIDVPWGKIRGKLWGKSDKQPILALHGWMDNAGTFDNLAPLLKNSSILAIDFPGHGLSSWISPGCIYTEYFMAKSVRTVVQHFGWEKVKFLGHSMGGITAYNYSRLYPQETDFVISIDSLGFFYSDPTKHNQQIANAIDKLINFEKKLMENPPSYPRDVAIDKWVKASVFKSIDVPCVETLMRRGAKQKEDGTYYYTRDFRVSYEFNNLHSKETQEPLIKNIVCPYLVLRATNTPFKKNIYWNNVAEVLKETSKDFNLVDVEGSHHVHLMHADRVAKHIIPFLEKYDL